MTAIVFDVLFIFFTCFLVTEAQYNVMRYGAKPDGKTDSTRAFLASWTEACASTVPATINVPPGRFLINNKIIFQGNNGYWLIFEYVDGVTLSGGVLDAKGSSLWSCKISGKNCPTGATSLAFSNSKNIAINGLTSENSQMFNIDINGCHNVKLEGTKFSSSGDSPNTDGIHVQLSSSVTIINSTIATGDDCISIGPGTTDLWIENVLCGPGHGISIGSLGKDLEEAGVQNVTVKTISFTGTQNGVRIKSWGRPSNGFARNILFQHVAMTNVKNPIVVDQNYCPHNINCPGQASGVKISNVTYQDIHGTSATSIAVKFDCSKKYPCTGIKMEDVNLTYKNQPAAASCNHADGKASGFIQPSSCFS
ncbi:hypothetical protein JCGZ_01182 [Jatropha curcas]|uniref:Polygalacturonase n=1 Tax=Jatropha curcas TaxID=180498 RepID=A0A067JGU9_JATCU|nr:hypothetical protein JCGZ_01182 [Jatropha curcas]